MSMDDSLELLGMHGVVPVLAIERPETALGLADALAGGGLPVAEVTFRTAAAAEAMRTLRRERPGLLLGAGTVLTVENVEAARAAGARFLVAPGLNPVVVRKAREVGLPMIPGIQTASELEQALELGCRVLKVFPAELAGGVGLIKALSGPYGHTGVRFLPTGGVNPTNLASYLEVESVLAVGGTWIAKKDAIREEKWDTITATCREAVGIVSRTRAT